MWQSTTHTYLLKISCFKLAQQADTSQLIISHLKHLERAWAELAFSITAEVPVCACVRDGDDAAANSVG